MKATFLSICFIVCFSFSYAQTDNQSKTNTRIGFELDALPYITGGYYGSIWVGHNNFRSSHNCVN